MKFKNYLVLILFFLPKIYSKDILLYAPGWVEDSLFFGYGARDDVTQTWRYWKESCAKLGYNLKRTTSLDCINNFEYLVCFDIPEQDVIKVRNFPKDKLFLYIFEPPLNSPNNYNQNNHKYFSKIFTLLDDWVDNKTYIKFYEPQPTLKYVGDSIDFEKRKLCTLLSSNITSRYPDELYSKRHEIINYFENNNVDDFEFYGRGWSHYKNYKGWANSKLETLKLYKFCVCYENTKNLNGYITGEKIFFCFITGCIPIYWGPKNVINYIPQNCFISGEQFKTAQDLYYFIKNITKEKYSEFIENIKNYLKTKQAFKFSSENFANIFCKNILPDYDINKLFNQEIIKLLE